MKRISEPAITVASMIRKITDNPPLTRSQKELQAAQSIAGDVLQICTDYPNRWVQVLDREEHDAMIRVTAKQFVLNGSWEHQKDWTGGLWWKYVPYIYQKSGGRTDDPRRASDPSAWPVAGIIIVMAVVIALFFGAVILAGIGL